jgi:hypothetical protein
MPSGLVLVGVDQNGNTLQQDPSGSTIANLVINKFPDQGIYLVGANNNTIIGDYLGLDVTGTQAGYTNGLGPFTGGHPDFNAIRLEGSSNNFIGTTAADYPLGINPANRNVLGQCAGGGCIDQEALNGDVSGAHSSNVNGFYQTPIVLSASSIDNVVQDNYIGVDKTGVNVIGGLNNSGQLCSSGSDCNRSISGPGGVPFEGNAMIMGGDQVTPTPAHSLFGGLVAGQGNIVAATNSFGVEDVVPGDKILGNTLYNNYFGDAINLDSPVVQNTLIKGNTIGTDINGTLGVYTGASGIFIDGNGSGTTIDSNVAVNTDCGICLVPLASATESNVLISNNTIGTNRAHTMTNGGNVDTGIFVSGGNSNIRVTGNVIAYNGSGEPGGGPGILIRPQIYFDSRVYTPKSVSLLGNSVYSNAGIGIDLNPNAYNVFSFLGNPSSVLVGDGPTLNNPANFGTGPNNLQSNPVFSSARNGSGNLIVKGTFNSVTSTKYRLQFFVGDSPNCLTLSSPSPAGYVSHCPGGGNSTFLASQGKQLIGETTVTTNGSGNATFSFNDEDNNNQGNGIPVGVPIVATATRLDSSGNPTDTSEFSQAILVGK